MRYDIQMLLKTSTDMCNGDNDRYTILTHAVQYCIINGNVNIIKLLLKYGININVVDCYKRSILMIMCCRNKNKNINIIKLLLKNGIDTNINKTDERGYTALKYLIKTIGFGNDINIVKLLLK